MPPPLERAAVPSFFSTWHLAISWPPCCLLSFSTELFTHSQSLHGSLCSVWHIVGIQEVLTEKIPWENQFTKILCAV